MVARSPVSLLPPEVRTELDSRLIGGAFSDYSGLEAWLRERGFEISRSSIHRYGQKLEKQIEAIKLATEQARAIAENTDDDENLLGDALSRLAQQKLFEVLLNLEENESVPKLCRAIADLNRSSISVKKWRSETREKAKVAISQMAQGGLSEETIKEIEERILGIL